MMFGLAVVFVSFSALLIASLRSPQSRSRVLSRSIETWIVDFSGLVTQGLVVPLLQTWALAPLWVLSMPRLQGALSLPSWASFVLSFVIIDYVYYWNHRLLHRPFFWKWHRLHHSASEIDIFATARNSLLTPLFIVYVWINSIFVFALGDPTPFLIASSLGAALDLWRHSGFSLSDDGLLFRWLNPWLILPQHHARHHAPRGAKADVDANYGANLKWWDQLHGTFDGESISIAGPIRADDNVLLRELIWPSRERSS